MSAEENKVVLSIEERLEMLEKPMSWGGLIFHPLNHMLEPGIPSKIEGLTSLLGRVSLAYIGYRGFKKSLSFFSSSEIKEEEGKFPSNLVIAVEREE